MSWGGHAGHCATILGFQQGWNGVRGEFALPAGPQEPGHVAYHLFEKAIGCDGETQLGRMWWVVGDGGQGKQGGTQVCDLSHQPGLYYL